MRSLILALIVIGFVFLYPQLENIEKSGLTTPLTQKPLLQQQKKEVRTNQIAYAPNSYLMAVGTPNGKLTLWDKHFESEGIVLQKQGKPIINVTFSKDENWLLATNSKDEVQLWNINSDHLVRIFDQLVQQGYLSDFTEFVEVDTFTESLVFMTKNGKSVYYNYETEELFDKPQIPIVVN